MSCCFIVESGSEKLGARRLVSPCAESEKTAAKNNVRRATRIKLTLTRLRQFSQRFLVRRARHAALAHNGRDVARRSHVERGVLRFDCFRSDRQSPEVRDFV